MAELLCVVGARPNFMKMAPILKALRAYPTLRPLLIHTGQHYDEAMSRVFFTELGLPAPDRNLEIGSDTHARQTARIMEAFDALLDERKDARLVLVVGDGNSTMACALVAVKRTVEVAHVEAGLRSRARGMPEEINRLVTDAVSKAGRMPPSTRVLAGDRHPHVGRRAVAALPTGGRRTEHHVDRPALGVGRRGRPETEIHSGTPASAGADQGALDADRGRLELGGSRFRVGGVDGQEVGRHVVREVERHERETGPQPGIDPDRCLDFPAARHDPRHLPFLQTEP